MAAAAAAERRLSLPIEGLTCATCAVRVERALGALPGVAAAVNLGAERAEVSFDPQDTSPAKLVTAVEDAGYHVPHETRELMIGGMSCASCVGRVEKALASAPGVLSASVNLANERALVEGVPGALKPADLLAAVQDAGYTAELVTGDAEADARRVAEEARRQRRELYRVVIALTLSAPLLLPMFGVPVAGWLQIALATPVQFVIGARFYTGAWKALRARVGNMDVLVALGTSAAYFYSLYLLISGASHHFYFEAAAVVIALIVLGKWFEGRAKRSTGAAIRALAALRPDKAQVERDGREIALPIAAVSAGDIVVVRPGERLPVDGIVLTGSSAVDESLLTGESLPITKAAGDAVTGGSINGAGLLRVSTTAVGEASTLARIIALVEGAQAKKAPVQRLVDRVASIFVPVVLACAAAAFLGWWLVGGHLTQGLISAVSVLVIACPCSLGLATPTALMVGTGAAARAGILIRDAEALERAYRIDTVVFDKTGTLTEGKPTVTDVVPLGAETEEPLVRMVAAAQKGSEHPLARAILAHAEGMTLPMLDDFQSRTGMGLMATVEGRELAIGNRRLMAEHGVALETLAARAAELETAGRTVTWAATLGPSPTLLGIIAVADPVRPSAADAVRWLAGLGVQSVLLTGDNERTARAVADQLNIDTVLAGVLPAGKAAEIERLRAEGRHVAMVGDGVNDAPALASADIGIAMGTGADVAMETAGVTLMRGDPLMVLDAIAISRATYSKIRQGLFWAFFYNVIGVPFAALGLLSPVVAGAAMAFSSVSVVSNALLLRRWRPSVV